MTRRPALPVLLAALAVLLAPGTASATTAADVSAELLTTPVYVDPQATVQIDEDRVLEAIQESGQPIYVAVVPSQAASANGGPDGLVQRIGQGLGSPAVLYVLAGNALAAGSSGAGLGRGEASTIARSQSSAGSATDALVGAVEATDAAIEDGAPAGAPDTSGSSGGGSNAGGSGALAVLALLGLGGGGLLYARSRKRSREAGKALEGSRADVESLYNRLGADVSSLHAGGDPVVQQALADAAERYGATGALLSQADTPGEFEAARRTAVEGLTAARLARTKLGLDPGPDIPPPPGQGPQLQAAGRVRVGDEEYEGSPEYAPGRQHYYGGGMVGGRMVPGGWYGVPFWETMLIGSMIGGGFGGFGGGYGGYHAGYEEGVEDATGGGGGGFGGGDWGGGGGFSGGDWGGGGGGDWGGGGFGGGGDGGSW